MERMPLGLRRVLGDLEPPKPRARPARIPKPEHRAAGRSSPESRPFRIPKAPGAHDPGAPPPGLPPHPSAPPPEPPAAPERAAVPLPGGLSAAPSDAPELHRLPHRLPLGGGVLRLSRETRESLKPPRHRGPHPAATLDVVRGFVEGTTLSYRVIAARTGVSIGTIARHVRRRGWIRPETGFPEEHYSPEGRSLMRRRALAERLLSLAETEVDRAALDPHGSPHALKKALQFLKALEKMEEAAAPKRAPVPR